MDLPKLIKPRLCMDCGKSFEGLLNRCPDCMEAAYNAELQHKQAEHARERTRAWQEVCPPIYHTTDWARVSPACRKLAHEWAPGYDGKPSLILFGQTGAGKTRAAFQILQRQYQAGYSVYAIHAGDAWDHGEHVQGLGSAARNVFSDNPRIAEAAHQCIQRARRCKLLLIDDLGKERSSSDRGGSGRLSETVGEALFGLIESRLVHRLATIITTNMDGKGLHERLGPDRGGPLLRRFSDEAHMPTI